jgi:hypothetical protein
LDKSWSDVPAAFASIDAATSKDHAMFSLVAINVAIGVLAAQRFNGMILAALSAAALIEGMVAAKLFGYSLLPGALWTFGLIVAAHLGYLAGAFLAASEDKQSLAAIDRNALS